MNPDYAFETQESPVLSIILPMFNEADGIALVLQRILALFPDQLDMPFEILVVDDGSSDGSVAAVKTLTDPRIRLLQHPYNIGNGAAVKTGIRHARGRMLVMLDADGQHDPADIPRLVSQLDTYDMAVGARTRESDSAWYRDIANQIYNTLATYVCARRIEDLTSGFRAIRTEVARSFVSLLPNTFSYPSTITLAVVRSGFTLTYVPIKAARRAGKSKIKLFRDGTRFLMIILKVTTLFSPLKVFIPAAISMFALGFGYGLFKVLFLGSRYGPTSAMLMTISSVVFLIGLISEQITQMRYDRIETRFQIRGDLPDDISKK